MRNCGQHFENLWDGTHKLGWVCVSVDMSNYPNALNGIELHNVDRAPFFRWSLANRTSPTLETFPALNSQVLQGDRHVGVSRIVQVLSSFFGRHRMSLRFTWNDSIFGITLLYLPFYPFSPHQKHPKTSSFIIHHLHPLQVTVIDVVVLVVLMLVVVRVLLLLEVVELPVELLVVCVVCVVVLLPVVLLVMLVTVAVELEVVFVVSVLGPLGYWKMPMDTWNKRNVRDITHITYESWGLKLDEIWWNCSLKRFIYCRVCTVQFLIITRTTVAES